ncbi:Meiotic recombination protein [Schistosoma japonicum]|uniref:DNA topoisomerase (ATP-hydrolyzing) n=1 Tax=Schistosoma japonicum TaxID=6182 RepID=A0A4Z2DKR4_SCHJA|nr:Meiotic recombination protein [Schistosoma japonicum]
MELLLKKPVEFTRLMVILKAAHEAIREDKFITKRAIYYSSPVLFKKQSTIDPLLSKICKQFNLPRCAIRINASSKLIIYGDIDLETVCKSDCDKINDSVIPESLFRNKHEVIISECLPQFILVIEKDTIFQKLLNEKFYEKFKPCLLITAKGYPDLTARQFLARLNYTHPNIPMFGLFDADPHGINVFCTYKFGTMNPTMQDRHGCPIKIPNLQLCGLLPSELSSLPIKEEEILNLTKNDKSLLISIQKRGYIHEEFNLLKQIKCLLFTEKKAELEILNSINSRFLTNEYLPKKLNYGVFYRITDKKLIKSSK